MTIKRVRGGHQQRVPTGVGSTRALGPSHPMSPGGVRSGIAIQAMSFPNSSQTITAANSPRAAATTTMLAIDTVKALPMTPSLGQAPCGRENSKGREGPMRCAAQSFDPEAPLLTKVTRLSHNAISLGRRGPAY